MSAAILKRRGLTRKLQPFDFDVTGMLQHLLTIQKLETALPDAVKIIIVPSEPCFGVFLQHENLICG